MMDKNIVKQIRDKAKELLSNGTIKCVLGYETGTDGMNARPAFIYEPEDVDRLIFDNTCTHNLSTYLRDKRENPVAIVVKPCDARAINVLLGERQIEREKVFIIGIVCQEVVQVSWGELSHDAQMRCKICNQHTPVIYDFLIGGPVDESAPKAEPPANVTAMEGKSSGDKVDFWSGQFSKCVRCYACRDVCMGCYCTVCFVDMLDPEWVGIKIATPENQMWNTIRAFHLSGRCIGCGECARVCPVNIPLDLLNMKMEKEVGEHFEFVSGLSSEEPAPLASFLKDESLGIGE